MTFLALGWPKNRRSEAVRAAPTTSARLDATQLYERHLDDVFGYVSRRLARREDAEDVCAEVFAAAFETLPRFRGEVEPKGWLLGIARRKVADALRRQVARREIELPPDWDAPDPNHHASPPRALLREENRRALRDVLVNLKDEQREALLLKYVEELSIEEIARVMNRSKAAANSLLQRARAAAFEGGRDYFLDFQAPDAAPHAPKNSGDKPDNEVNS